MELNDIAVFSPPSASMSGQSEADNQSVCPLCSHEVRLYYINFNEKIEMCGNIECDYPFGYVPLKLVSEEDGVQSKKVESVRSKGSCSTVSTSSLTTVSGWSDVEKMCNIVGVSGIPGLDVDKIRETKLLETAKNNEQIQKKVQQIKEMTNTLNITKKGTIKNEKWLKNLLFLQGLSGVNLMKPEEMKKISRKKPFLGTGELKIDIDNNNTSAIKIQINHQNKQPVLRTYSRSK